MLPFIFIFAVVMFFLSAGSFYALIMEATTVWQYIMFSIGTIGSFLGFIASVQFLAKVTDAMGEGRW
jgi:hypothetical protein